jgi:GT2 family glycosyltransferase
MKWRLFIPFVNRRDLLERALQSVSTPEVTVIDNSEGRQLYADVNFRSRYQVLCPPVPLGISQSNNYIIRLADDLSLDTYLCMHTDAEVVAGGFERFLSLIPELPANWGAAFTNYDLLAAFNVKAVQQVGLWDWVRFPNYFADTDYYHRIRLAGFETIWVDDVDVIHHNGGSNTLKADKTRAHVEKMFAKTYLKLYVYKWGGKPEHERFVEPRIA